MNKENLEFNMWFNLAILETLSKLMYSRDGSFVNLMEFKFYKSNNTLILRTKRMRNTKNYQGSISLDPEFIINNINGIDYVSPQYIKLKSVFESIISKGGSLDTGIFKFNKINDYELATEFYLSIDKLLAFNISLLDKNLDEFKDNNIIKPLYINDGKFDFKKTIDYIFSKNNNGIIYDTISIRKSKTGMKLWYHNPDVIKIKDVEIVKASDTLEGNIIPQILHGLFQYTKYFRTIWLCYGYQFRIIEDDKIGLPTLLITKILSK